MSSAPVVADGFVRGPGKYEGSLEESSQEAVIIVTNSPDDGMATEDLILKISVKGEVDHFAWVIPFPNEPVTEKADSQIFKELFDYVEYRLTSTGKGKGKFSGGMGGFGGDGGVEVLSRKTVGSYDVAVVRENAEGALNQWLDKEGFQRIENGDDVIKFYREKGYVFACVKVSDAQLAADTAIDLHPLRFTFKTGGRDGIYFPMKLTGLQHERFDVNLYVFYRFWLNDDLNRFGYVKRGFSRKYRDWDGPHDRPNEGKRWAKPETDPFLRNAAKRIPTVGKLFAELHPNEKFYLTNIRAVGLDPPEVKAWPDDLWLFPYYRDPHFIPHDARSGGPAAVWADVK
jgi:hypothetical protein